MFEILLKLPICLFGAAICGVKCVHAEHSSMFLGPGYSIILHRTFEPYKETLSILFNLLLWNKCEETNLLPLYMGKTFLHVCAVVVVNWL